MGNLTWSIGLANRSMSWQVRIPVSGLGESFTTVTARAWSRLDKPGWVDTGSAMTAMKMARQEGLSVGLFRPITLFPFPNNALSNLARKIGRFLVAELSFGQMIEDVRLSVEPGTRVDFFGLPPGSLPAPDVFLKEIKKVYTE